MDSQQLQVRRIVLVKNFTAVIMEKQVTTQEKVE
jgi:hypothetical protein